LTVDLKYVNDSLDPLLNHANLKFNGNGVETGENSHAILKRIMKYPDAEILQIKDCRLRINEEFDNMMNSLKSLKKLVIDNCDIEETLSHDVWNLSALKNLTLSFNYSSNIISKVDV
jgi:Leucine-rich repeat (LRR) protein